MDARVRASVAEAATAEAAIATAADSVCIKLNYLAEYNKGAASPCVGRVLHLLLCPTLLFDEPVIWHPKWTGHAAEGGGESTRGGRRR